MDEASERRVRRLVLATYDLTQAQRFAQALQSLRDKPDLEKAMLSVVEESLIISAIVMYARPFRNSYSGGVADKAVSEADLFDQLSGMADLDHFRALHDEILSLRDSAVAHADWKHHQTWNHDQRGQIVVVIDLSKVLEDLPSFFQLLRMTMHALVTLIAPPESPDGPA